MPLSRGREPLALALAVAGLAAAVRSLARLMRAGRRRHRLGPGDPAGSATVSVVVPARDEAANIVACVRSLLAQELAPAEVVVVDDGSSDATAELARAAGARVVAAPPPAAGATGKSSAAHAGALAARLGDWLAFVDADVRLAPAALSRLVAAGTAGGAGAVSAFGRPVAEHWWNELLVPELGLAVAESLDLSAVADPRRPAAFLSGQCLLVRREAYEAVGGFAAVAGSVVEDLALAARLKAAGYGLEVRLAPELLDVRMYARPLDAWHGLVRGLPAAFGTGRRDVGAQVLRAAGGLAPWVALALRPSLRARALAGAGGALHVLLRAGGRFVAGADPAGAAGYPLADQVLLAAYLAGLRRRRRGGSVVWRGRSYRMT